MIPKWRGRTILSYESGLGVVAQRLRLERTMSHLGRLHAERRAEHNTRPIASNFIRDMANHTA